MRLFLSLTLALTVGAFSAAEGQEKFFTLSGGSKGDVANAKTEAQIQQLKARQSCGEQGMLQGKDDISNNTHPVVDGSDCITALQIQDDEDVDLSNDLRVSGDAAMSQDLDITSDLRVTGSISIGGTTVKSHALSIPLDCTTGKMYWNGSAWACRSESDPEVDPTGTGWCSSDGSKVTCTEASPMAAGSETDPTVQAFAKTSNPLPTCGASEVLKADGTSLFLC